MRGLEAVIAAEGASTPSRVKERNADVNLVSLFSRKFFFFLESYFQLVLKASALVPSRVMFLPAESGSDIALRQA